MKKEIIEIRDRGEHEVAVCCDKLRSGLIYGSLCLVYPTNTIGVTDEMCGVEMTYCIHCGTKRI